MKNKTKRWGIVLTLVCCLFVGTLTACADSGDAHTHSYTEWRYDETQHWKVCADDGAASEKEAHVFIAGKCECGAAEAAETETATARGNIRLKRKGLTDTDYGNVTVDVGDDKVTVKVDGTTGAFTLENLAVGREYTLRISKANYQDFTAVVAAEEDGESIDLGDCTLGYVPFAFFTPWDGEQHDFTHVNDDDSYITMTMAQKTLNVLSKESYGNVSATLTVKESNSLQEWHVQGIVLKFDDGKHIIVRVNMNDRRVLEFKTDEWGADGFAASNFVPLGLDMGEWGEYTVHTLTDDEMALWQGHGIDFNLTVKDGVLYVMLGGKAVGTAALPDGYADKKVQVGYYCYSAAANVPFHYDITETMPEYTVTVPEAVTGGAVGVSNLTPALGDEVTVTLTPAEGYSLTNFTVNGKTVSPVYDSESGAYTYVFTATANAEIGVSFDLGESITLEDITLSVRTYLGEYKGALPARVTLTGTAKTYTVAVEADGTLGAATDETDSAVTEIETGAYLCSADGFLARTVTLTHSMKEISLDYDGFTFFTPWDHDKHDFSHANDAADPYLTMTEPGKTLNVLTKDSFGNVSATLTVKESNSTSDWRVQGIALKFDDGKHIIVRINMNDRRVLEFKTDEWGENGGFAESNFVPLAGIENWSWGEHTVHTLTDDEMALWQGDGIDFNLTLKDGVLYVLLDGKAVGTVALPEGYADKTAQVAFYGYTSAPDAVYRFNISEDVSHITA